MLFIIALIVVLLVVWWRLSSRRTRAIYLAGPQEREAHLAQEAAQEAEKKYRSLRMQQLLALGVLAALVFLAFMQGY
jgi:hypothetical protein